MRTEEPSGYPFRRAVLILSDVLETQFLWTPLLSSLVVAPRSPFEARFNGNRLRIDQHGSGQGA